MKTTNELTDSYIDAALDRMEVGLTRRLRARRARTIAISASAVVATIAVVSVAALALHAPALVSPPQALGLTPLTPADVASWTSTPQPVTELSGVAAYCGATLAKEPFAVGSPTIVTADARGRVQSAIVSLGGYVGYCIGSAGQESSFGLLEDLAIPGHHHFVPPTLAPDAIDLGESGARTTADGWYFAEGYVGSDVTGVVIHTSGLDVTATVGGGYWMAWWPASHPDGIIRGTFDWTGANGTTHTATPAQLQAQ